jgi:hypothetical protein
MFLFVAEFKSGHLGGKAVVLAENEEKALRLLNEKHYKKLKPEDVKFTINPNNEHVIYYDNGDY